MAFLEGKNVAPRLAVESKKLVGKRVRYLRSQDIDKSGRGHFFPRTGIVESIYGRNIMLDNGIDIHFSDIVELVVINDETE
ncbi:hypothetical protein [Paenibacillus sp. XY044]|uniref:hypothetical protein n=1 Tax=Paenibacillus sp. XY044 TaxID=2026089 RepID=UPI000B992A54|nr:hypothetical protein [Paenibacillus sp. XY044]OZB98064.1 hypothetical protein CJP46_02540 [Paenibacillus sp. XY044]